jgi:hypothetical protein
VAWVGTTSSPLGAPMAGWRTGRRHRRCSSARGRVTSLYRWRVCSLATGGRRGGGASGERTAGRHRSDRGSRRGGMATWSVRRLRHAHGHGEGAAWEGGSLGGARVRAPRQWHGRGRGATQRNVLDWRRLTEFCSKILNRSAQSGK